jgi:hypothetical protein
MNTIKDDWEDDDEDDSPQLIMSQAEQMKLDARKKEEDADHELTEDLFLLNKQTKSNTAPAPLKPLFTKPKQKEFVSKKEDNERKIKDKVAVKKQVAASKQKHATVFGHAELDSLQDEYCDYEDRY